MRWGWGHLTMFQNSALVILAGAIATCHRKGQGWLSSALKPHLKICKEHEEMAALQNTSRPPEGSAQKRPHFQVSCIFFKKG